MVYEYDVRNVFSEMDLAENSEMKSTPVLSERTGLNKNKNKVLTQVSQKSNSGKKKKKKKVSLLNLWYIANK